MIQIVSLEEFGLAAVGACANIEEHILISTEAELKDLINGVKAWPLLVCVLPSASGDDRGLDNYAESNSGLFFVLSPYLEKFTRTERLAVWQKTMDGMGDLKQFIRHQMSDQTAAFYEILSDADFGKRTIDAEYNFLGCVGWSLIFDYTTSGL